MIPARIPQATRHLGAPPGWRPDQDGVCGHLAVRDVQYAGETVNRMLSLWELDPEELARVRAGAKVILSVVGVEHPPVWLAVADVPEDMPAMSEAEALAAPGDVRRHKKGGLYRVLSEDALHRPWAATWTGNTPHVPGQLLTLYEHLWPHRPALYQRPRAEFEEWGRFHRVVGL